MMDAQLFILLMSFLPLGLGERPGVRDCWEHAGQLVLKRWYRQRVNTGQVDNKKGLKEGKITRKELLGR